MNEAELVLSGLLGCDRPQLLARRRERLDAGVRRRLAQILRRRCSGEPLAYITGCQDFFGLSLTVSPDVLIPRQDTEVLVEACLRCCRGIACPRILDIGTGSAAIAVSLAVYLPQARITATDISPAALAIARSNCLSHGVQQRVECLVADLFPALPESAERFDLIVSNPPYIRRQDIPGLQPEVRHEPACALDGGSSGLDFYCRICSRAADYLAPGGCLALEVGFDQRSGVEDILAQTKKFSLEAVIKDYNDIDRVIIARRQP